MDITQFTQLRAAVSISGSGGVVVSATLFAACDWARWNLVSGSIQWQDLVNSSTFSLYEIDDVSSTFAAGSNSSSFFVMNCSTTSGQRDFFLGDRGIPASGSLTYLVMQVGSVTGNFFGTFIGYQTGGVS